MTYKQLRKRAKELHVRANGTYEALSDRVHEAEKRATASKEDTPTPEKQKAEPTNKFGKTEAQVKKDNEAAAGLMAAGRM